MTYRLRDSSVVWQWVSIQCRVSKTAKGSSRVNYQTVFHGKLSVVGVGFSFCRGIGISKASPVNSQYNYFLSQGSGAQY